MIRPLSGPRLPPANGQPPRKLVVLLHGYGANGDDLIALGSVVGRLLPDALFLAPNAPDPVPGGFGGFQWFSLSHYDPNMLRRDPKHSAAIYGEMLEGAEKAAPSINAFIDEELARHKIDPANLALIGFSQGTMMSLHVGLRRTLPPACIIGFSGALLGADRLKTEAQHKPPVLLVHGDADDVVPPEALFAALSGLGEAEIPAEFHVCPGLGHGIDEEGLQIAARFLINAFRHRGNA